MKLTISTLTDLAKHVNEYFKEKDMDMKDPELKDKMIIQIVLDNDNFNDFDKFMYGLSKNEEKENFSESQQIDLNIKGVKFEVLKENFKQQLEKMFD